MPQGKPFEDQSRGGSGIAVVDGSEHAPQNLFPGTPSFTSSIAQAIVIKEGNIVLLTEPDGSVPVRGEDGHEHGLGLYVDDCRYLSGYELSVAGMQPSPLAATAGRGFMAVVQLNGPDLRLADGRHLPHEELGIKWERVIDGEGQALHDRLLFENFGPQRLAFPVTLTFQAGFEDVFAVRELVHDHGGTPHLPHWQGGTLWFAYDGIDGVSRRLSVSFSPAPHATDATTASFYLTLDPRQHVEILVSLTIDQSARSDDGRRDGRVEAPRLPNVESLAAVQQRAADAWLRDDSTVHSDSLAINRIVERSFRDLYLLRSHIGTEGFFAAGVPWFATLFGRDSLITALQTLAYNPRIAEQTLRLLARHQGSVVDDWRDEQPGKILHELRTGELARAGRIPHTPYYGTVDATPLFLILMARHAAWTGYLTLFRELRGNVERALRWMTEYGGLRNPGYLVYQRRSEGGLDNQGWKDSYDGIVNRDGSLAVPPIALAEVQGYAYLALTGIADLYERAGDGVRAAQLRQEAEALRARFNRDFWLEDEGCYALALQSGGRAAAVVASNAGQVLWTGIADEDKAQRTVTRLMADDMFTGYGVRTLSAREQRYNPNGYHVGSVWPHDNSIIAAGFRRYGCDDAAGRVFMGMVEAAMDFDQYRLPELFAGYPREEYGIPVRYPVACRPQAWAAGSVPFLLSTVLGLVPEAFERRLRIVRPWMPAPTYYIELRSLRVGDARVDLRFERTPAGTSVRTLRIEGSLDIVVEGADVRV